jgi:hypothetical protein
MAAMTRTNTTIAAGYEVRFSTAHPAATVAVQGAVASVQLLCLPSAASVHVSIAIPDGRYTSPSGSTSWLPASASTAEARVAVPAGCSNQWISLLQSRATVSGRVLSDAPGSVDVRFRVYAVDATFNTAGWFDFWSPPVTVQPAALTAAPTPSGGGSTSGGGTIGGSPSAGPGGSTTLPHPSGAGTSGGSSTPPPPPASSGGQQGTLPSQSPSTEVATSPVSPTLQAHSGTAAATAPAQPVATTPAPGVAAPAADLRLPTFIAPLIPVAGILSPVVSIAAAWLRGLPLAWWVPLVFLNVLLAAMIAIRRSRFRAQSD